MSDDNICPRCDHPLEQPPAVNEPETDFETDEPEIGPETLVFSAAEDETIPLEDETPPDLTAETGVDLTASEPPAPDEDRALLPTTRLPEVESEPSAPEENRATPPTTRLPNAVPIFDRVPDVRDEEPERAGTAGPQEIEAVESGDQVEALPELPEIEEPEEPPEPEEIAAPTATPFVADVTHPRLNNHLAEAEEEDTSEVPTARNVPGERAAPPITEPRPAYIVPPAPYTPPPTPAPPPPAQIAPPVAPYAYGYMPPAVPPAVAYVQQRVQAYLRAGYRLQVNSPYEATLSLGKGLGAGGCLLALVSIIGSFWYLMLLALSGFQRDVVDIVLESDGHVYEDGPGAAHVRQGRARVGRRWAMFGTIIFVVSLLLIVVLGIVAGIMLSNDRYQAAMREAYPAVTLFEEHFSTTEASPDDVSLAKDGAVAYAIVGGIAAVGLWGGATLWVIGTVHARAYRVHVPALPGWG
jgi:hypothetical protein